MIEDKDFKKRCNDLRCPLCGSQLDGSVHFKSAKLYCVSNGDEYICEILDYLERPYFERISYFYAQNGYEIHIWQLADEKYKTTIYHLNMDFIPSYRARSKKLLFDYVGERLLFFRTRMEEEQFIKKLKTYITFS